RVPCSLTGWPTEGSTTYMTTTKTPARRAPTAAPLDALTPFLDAIHGGKLTTVWLNPATGVIMATKPRGALAAKVRPILTFPDVAKRLMAAGNGGTSSARPTLRKVPTRARRTAATAGKATRARAGASR